MTDTNLGDINLGDEVLWTNRHAWSRCLQIQTPTLGGGVRVAQQFRTAGQPIVLDCGWLTLAQVAALCELRDSGALFTLTHQGESWRVGFDHSGDPPVEATPILDVVDPDDADYLQTTVRLITL